MRRKKRMRCSILSALSSHQLHDDYGFFSSGFDLVISCGGFYGFYLIGVDKILKKLERKGNIWIRRYAGSSVGAFCAVLMCCGVSTRPLLDMYERMYERSDYFSILREEIMKLLPENGYILCSGRVFIHTSEVSWRGLHPVVFSQFESNEDMVEACMASSNFPFLISPHMFYPYRGRYFLDGCVLRMLPVFPDSSLQLLIKLYRLDYSLWYLFRPTDQSIEGLVVKGAIEADKFFSSSPRPISMRVIQWYSGKKRNKYRSFLLPILGSVTGCIAISFCLKWRQSAASILNFSPW